MIIVNILKKGLEWIFIFIIKIYQWVISPLLGPSCRFDPTCSVYGVDAIKTHGPFKGIYLAIRRILRCHPWGGHGYDPVPPKIKKMKKEL